MDFSQPPWSDLVAFIRNEGFRIAVIVVVAFVVYKISKALLHGLFKALLDREATEGTAQELSAIEVRKRLDTLDRLGGNVVRFFVIVIAGLMILTNLGIDIGPAVAGLGVVGIAVGFGTQTLIRDYMNGCLILIENQFSRGDVVTIAGVTGTVEDFSLRRTTLRDLDGIVHTVPNSQILVASNRTRTWARINQNVVVAFGTDVEKAIDAVNAVGQAMAADPKWKRRILDPPRVDRVESIDSAVGITLKILGTVRASDQWAASGEFRQKLLTAFAEKGIEIPGPRVTLPEDDEPGPRGGGPTEEELVGGE
ncbi:MAG TPA: mechanosensitive ion channel family protein [Candidatus Limnocylindrales bacterium]|nr:mechanosensitive ion channel family protein [Candidatus Limnocylindrales bacterium]